MMNVIGVKGHGQNWSTSTKTGHLISITNEHIKMG